MTRELPETPGIPELPGTPEIPEALVLGEVLRARAASHSNETFLKLRDGERSFGEVDARADRMAQGFAALGVAKGDHVAVMLPNGADLVVAVLALGRLGAVTVPVNPEYRGDLLRQVLAGSDSSVLVIDGPLVDQLAPIVAGLPDLRLVIARTDERDPALEVLGPQVVGFTRLLAHGRDPVDVAVSSSDLQAIMFTSGTTGPSKGAEVPHALALTCAIDSVRFVGSGGATIYCPLPLFHAAGLWDGMMSALVSGGSLAVVERFSASRFWDDVRHFDARVAMSVFSMIPILLKRPARPDDADHPLRTFYMGKSTLDQPLHDRFGVRAVETYTSTEVGIATASPYGEWRTGSCGQAHAERFDVAIVDELDRELGPGEPGELVVRPKQPFVMTTGYHGSPEVTARCFRNLWFHTGDRAYRDDDGYFFFVDRAKDAIRRRGENISAFDLECEVNRHPAVLESAAIGVPSELEDDDVKVAVVLRHPDELDEAGLVAFCEERLPKFMVPRYVEIVDELPRTPTDKVAKHELRAAGDRGITSTTWDRESADVPAPTGER